MKCPNCHFENPDGMKYCGECGQEIHPSCPHCGFTNPPNFKFCGNCGCDLSAGKILKIDIHPEFEEVFSSEDHHYENACDGPDSERKCVTVMFSDLTGYTEMSERLDPEEVKEITSAIFGELTKIIEKYDGFIEKYIGDAILAVFGAKAAFEDSALRAIKAAREIHTHVESISPKYEKRIGRSLTMHTGINTGVVVTGEINFEKGTHGLVGDTINTAARLMSASESGEIIIDHDSFVQTEGYFEHEPLNSVSVKGKAAPIHVYRVGKALREPKKLHRLHGLRARLIGRSVEMQILRDAAENLQQGQGSVVSVCGTAGTGKSRLVHEFKKTLSLEKIQWFDANAYPYTQNTPYYPLIDLLTKAFDIREGDNSGAIKHKVESSLEGLLGKGSEDAPYIGSLFSIEYSEAKDVSPEYWKDQLYAAIGDVLKALTATAPTVICLEDIHWADPSTMELVRKLVSSLSGPLMVICIYRPVITIFTDFEIKTLPIDYTELRLRELSPSESQDMICSLLNADQIPKELRGFIRDSIDGNPFYVEELINALIDSEALSNESGQWVLTKTIDDSFISTNIQGVIAGRIDRLGRDTKRILQEASVIGRAFLYDILNRISEIKENIDQNLVMLERLDLISAKSIQPTLEYIFKHALTQEIVYNGLVKPERKMIHEKIGNVIEILFQDRLPEFFETLSYHYVRGTSKLKAVDYLSKSAIKSLKRYSLDEAHRYFQEAYDILNNQQNKTIAEKELIIDLILEWALVFYYRCDVKGWKTMFEAHKELAESIDDQERLAMFCAWHGFVFLSEDNKKAMTLLQKALNIAENIKNRKIIGYACTWLTWVCSDLSKFEEALKYGHRAQEIAKTFESDHYLYFKSLGAMAMCYWNIGDTRKLYAAGKELLDYGKKYANIRCQTMGHMALGGVYNLVGDYPGFINSFQKALNVSADTMYDITSKAFLGLAYLLNGQPEEAEPNLQEVVNFTKEHGFYWSGMPGKLFLGSVLIATGDINTGFKMIEEAHCTFIREGRKYYVALTEYILGKIYSQIVQGTNSISPLSFAKNIGFLVKSVPFADKKADSHFKTATEIAKTIDAKSILGPAYLDWGLLHKAKKRKNRAIESIYKAIEIFEMCEATVYMGQAKKVLKSLGQ